MGEDKVDKVKKIFIVAPYFPPSPLPPSQRVRLIVRHSASLGFYPIVFTVDPSFREEKQDPWMLELTGNDHTLVNVDCFHQNQTRKIKIGDIGLRMMPFLFFKLRRYIKQENPEFILYPVPPWYILIIAPIIKWLTKVPYGIDFIDPWVYPLGINEQSLKSRISQWIARRLEGWTCKHTSVIYSVSEGINADLIKRHPSLSKKPFFAIPYGAEETDFDTLRKQIPIEKNEKIVMRYIGALWHDSYPVLDGLMPALKIVSKDVKLQVEFLGTTYAREVAARSQLDRWISKNDMSDFAVEKPLRVSYKRAVELTLQSDISLLIGGMHPNYAASKLMGLIVSKKIFIAFVLEGSFPANLLAELKFPYVVTYSASDDNLPITKINSLVAVIKKAIDEKDRFTGIDLNHPLVQEHTAKGMTNAFLEPINKLYSYDELLR